MSMNSYEGCNQTKNNRVFFVDFWKIYNNSF